MKHLKGLIEIAILVFRGFERKHLTLIAAGLSYYFLMALFPAVILLTGIVAYLPLENSVQRATSFLAHVMPPQGLSLIEPTMTTIASHRTGLLSLGIAATLWVTSKGAEGIIAGLDIVYEVRTPRPLWVNRILAFGLTFGVGILVLLATILALAGPALGTVLTRVIPVQSLWIRVWPYIHWLLAATFTFCAIALLYLFAPNVPRARRLTVPGALIAASTWLALSWGLGYYFQHFGELKLDTFYGILAAPIALVIWLKSGAAAILVGAEINVCLQSRKTVRSSAPKEISSRVDAA
jgi:membrane protein